MQSVCFRAAGHPDLGRAEHSNCWSSNSSVPTARYASTRTSSSSCRSRMQQQQSNPLTSCSAMRQQPFNSVVQQQLSSLSSSSTTQQQFSQRPQGCPRRVVPTAATAAAAQLTAAESVSSLLSGGCSCPPVSPQRTATQRCSGGGRGGAAAAAAAAATATTAQCDASITQQQQQPSQQQQQQHHSMARQESSSMSGAHVWLPEKQLWLPHPAAAVANPTNPLGRSSMGGQHGPSGLARVFMASAATAGRKRHMEDRHVLAALHPEHGVTAAHQGAVTPQQAVSLAAVFDGHAGAATASYAAQHIPRLLHNALSGQARGSSADGPAVLTRELLTPRSALAASFHWFDRWWSDARCDTKFTQHGWDESGSTAVIGMVSGQQLVVANAGDSVALLAHNGTSRRLTEAHRLDNEAEAARVTEAGGQVVRNTAGGAPRVVGTSSQTRYKGIMVTRSLGDFAYKSPQALLSAEPYVVSHQLEPSDHLVLLTSDGVTDVLPDDDMLGIGLTAIEQARSLTNNGNALAQMAAQAVMEAALDKGSNDNITVVAMLLDWGSEYDEDDVGVGEAAAAAAAGGGPQ